MPQVPPKAHVIENQDNKATNKSQSEALADSIRPLLDKYGFKASLKLDKPKLPSCDDSDESRILAIQHLAKTLYVPTPELKILNDKIHTMIKLSYKNRSDTKSINEQQQEIFKHSLTGSEIPWIDAHSRTTESNSLLLVGPKGFGKSEAIHRCLSLHSQVLWHESSHQCQIVHLKIDLARAHSVIDYCKFFLAELESALGEQKYIEEVQVPRCSVTALHRIEALLATYHVGVIVIDSLESIATWQLKAQYQLLTHFYSVNINTPIVYVGREDILEIKSIAASRVMDNLQSGSMYWDPLYVMTDQIEKIDKRWHSFTKYLWKYHCLKNHVQDLCPELRRLWFDACQGNTKLAMFIFTQSQLEAIRTKKECITVDIMRSVFTRELRPIMPKHIYTQGNEDPKPSKPANISEGKRIGTEKSNFASGGDIQTISDNTMPIGFKRVSKKSWKDLPDTDLRHLFAVCEGKQMLSHLKLKNLVLSDKVLLGFEKLPDSI